MICNNYIIDATDNSKIRMISTMTERPWFGVGIVHVWVPYTGASPICYDFEDVSSVCVCVSENEVPRICHIDRT